MSEQEFPEWVYIRLRRTEGYEDVCDELVMEDAHIHAAFEPEIVPHIVDEMHRKHTSLLSENERLTAEVARLTEAIQWALGERGEFPIVDGPPYYRWRSELRERAGLAYDRDAGVSTRQRREEALQELADLDAPFIGD